MTGDLAQALRACADGICALQAGVELLISHGTFLDRADFTSRFVWQAVSVSDGATPMAGIDWPAAITALDAGELAASGGEQRMLRLAASIAGGIPVDLRCALTGLDESNVSFVVSAVLHACGQQR